MCLNLFPSLSLCVVSPRVEKRRKEPRVSAELRWGGCGTWRRQRCATMAVWATGWEPSVRRCGGGSGDGSRTAGGGRRGRRGRRGEEAEVAVERHPQILRSRSQREQQTQAAGTKTGAETGKQRDTAAAAKTSKIQQDEADERARPRGPARLSYRGSLDTQVDTHSPT